MAEVKNNWMEKGSKNYRIVIIADTETTWGRQHSSSDQMRALEKVRAQISKHCDLEDTTEPILQSDSFSRCKFCKDENPNYDDGSPGCCTKAQTEYINEVGEEVAFASKAIRDFEPDKYMGRVQITNPV